MCVHVCVCTHVFASTCSVPKLLLGVILHCSSTCSLRQSLSIKLESSQIQLALLVGLLWRFHISV